jgi:hypothetical protein
MWYRHRKVTKAGNEQTNEMSLAAIRIRRTLGERACFARQTRLWKSLCSLGPLFPAFTSMRGPDAHTRHPQ